MADLRWRGAVLMRRDVIGLAIALAAAGTAPDQVITAVFAAAETWAAGVPWHDDLTLVAIVAD